MKPIRIVRSGTRRDRGAARILLGAATLLVILILAWLLIRSPDNSPPRTGPSDGDDEARGAIPPDDGGEVVRLSKETNLCTIQIVDALTGEPLQVAVELSSEGVAALQLQSGLVVELPSLGGGGRLRYSLYDGSVFETAAALRSTLGSGVLKIPIPYYCLVTVLVPDEALQLIDSSTEVGLLKVPLADVTDDLLDPGSVAQLYQPQYRDSTFHGMMSRYSHLQGTQVMAMECAEKRIPALALSAQGDFAIGVVLGDGTAGYAPVRLEPGREVIVQLDLAWRPRVYGTLVDWNNNPVPNAVVTGSSSLDMQDYDYSPRDTAGVAALRIGGVMHQATKQSVRTDAHGNFNFVLPRGRQYCVESDALDGRAFWSTLDSGTVIAPGASVEIELTLESPDSESAFVFEVLHSDGSPFPGIAAQLGVVDDIPFIRQWPKKPTGPDGTVRFLGGRPGDSCRLLLFDPIFKGGMFVPDIIVLPPDYRVRVIVPASAFQSQQ